MKTYLALDTEDDSKGSVFCINFYDGVEHFTFTDQDTALRWLCERPGHIEVWATNLGYDLNNLFCGFLEKLEITYVESRIISARIIKAQVYFRDTLNHWKLSVEEMGRRIGLRKIKTRAFKNVAYCRRDTEITFKFIMAMKKEYEKIGCTLKATIGATALEYFYSKFCQRPNKEQVMSLEELLFCKKGYYGGRTEIFYTKPIEGNIQYFDINSLYPSVMRDFEFPKLESRHWVRAPDFSKEGMVHASIQSASNKIPYLPWRGNKGLLFPNGNIEGHYTYFEIRKALELDYKICKIHKALEFREKVRPFVSFVETLYAARLKAQSENDELLSNSTKLILNNLYGKFAQGNMYSQLTPYTDPTKVEGVVYGNLILNKIKGKYPLHTNAIWSCYVTAYARHRLYQGLSLVENDGGLLIYCDTDSIIFESEKKIIKPSNRLGEFKLEGEYKYAHFKLPKLYCLIPKKGKWIFKAKGIPIKSAANYFKKGKAKFRRPYKLKESLRRNLSPKKIHELIPNYWEMNEKETKSIYDKRIIHSNGTTSPVVL
jgi:hypothetical protein